MILPLRRRHRIMMGLLGVILPVGLVAGLVSRKSAPPAVETVPGVPASSLARLDRLIETAMGGPPGEARWGIRLYAADFPVRLAVKLAPQGAAALDLPDLLVYWSEGASESGRGVPEDSHLLGSLPGDRPAVFVLPEAAAAAGGRLIFFSLARGELLDFEWASA